ncbi:MAG: glutamine-hydrolyzing carbamoyl-phosphate synthase small subunit [Acidobacteriota bacterium]|nr:glutamine-hydrolyzing carbamoyl-phosphate synthase small subunit [Acidobacteriota bacterium]
MEAILALEDGRVFRGRSLGMVGLTTGEVVFNTGMTGYQEIITDPSYRGQIVTLTVPHVGNTGINDADPESSRPQAAGLVVRDGSRYSSSWRSLVDLDHFLRTHQIVGIEELDTRALTRHLRSAGVLRGCLASNGTSVEQALTAARAAPRLEEQDLVGQVTCAKVHRWTEGRGVLSGRGAEPRGRGRRIAVLDCGIKRNILRLLVDRGFDVLVFPAQATAGEILAAEPEGVFLSNGPGDPAVCDDLVATIGRLIGAVPVFGICLGHQLACRALGARTFKLKFGHRGTNHPVRDERSGRVAITSQNHGYAVDPETLPAELEITHRSLYDGTVEGVAHRELPLMTVQFHPEAAPGPHDAWDLFEDFVDLVEHRRPLGELSRRRTA